MTEHQEHTDPLAGLDFDPETVDEPIDMTAMLTRRFAWDTMACSLVPDLLSSLGLTHGTDEGMKIDHVQSHERLAQIFFMEPTFQAYAGVLGVVLTKAIMMVKGMELAEEDEIGFCSQNAELILSGARAMVGQLVATGVLQPGPRAGVVQVVLVEGDDDSE